MSTFGTARRAAKNFFIVLVLFSTILISISADTVHPVQANDVAVSPGKYDLRLGNSTGLVTLSYPNSSILTNSVGDLLFTVTLEVKALPSLPVPPITLNPTSGPAGSTVTITGSGFNPSDAGTYPCVTSTPTTIVTAATCTFSISGSMFGSFTVLSTAVVGTYTITVKGNTSDSASAPFIVTTASITLSPSSRPAGSTVIITGSGFNPSDTGTYPCVTTPLPIVPPPPTCTFSTSGSMFGSFTITSTALLGVYTIVVTGKTGDSASAPFTVALPPPSASEFYCSTANLALGDCPVSFEIYIPPDFTGLSIGNTWTSFTNDYDSHRIRLSRLSSADQIGPNWWEVTLEGLSLTCKPLLANPANGVFLAYPTCSGPPLPLPATGNYTTKPQYVRLFQVTSPTTAGRYFFKAFINGVSIGASNFPTLVVKASRDPAIISGTLRDLGDRNASRAGQPIFLLPGTGAEVIAAGYDPLGRSVSAQAFINSTADGKYTLFGVAPGTYNLTVYAAGYIPITITEFPYPYPFFPSIIKPTPITVDAAQSLEGVDIYLSDSAQITGTVLSETAGGLPIPWGTVCSVSSGSFGSFGSTAPSCFTPRAITVDLLNLEGTTVVASSQPPSGVRSCPQPPFPSSPFCTVPSATEYTFAFQNELSSWDGRIPQDNASFTSGLPSGEDYLLRAYVTSYVQLEEVRVHVANATLDTEAPIPLIRTGIFDVTVHFKNSNSTGSTLVDNPIEVSGTLTVSAYDMQGILRAQNTTSVFEGNRTASIELLGFSNARQRGTASLFQQNYGILPGTYYIQVRFTAAPPVAGNAATTTNAPVPGALVVGDLYYQTSIVLATIGLGLGIVRLSFPLYKAGGIQLGIYSIDTEVPPLYYNWRFPGKTVLLTLIPTSENLVYQTNTTQLFDMSSIRLLNVTGLLPGSYDLVVSTLGYTQENIVHFTVTFGTNADASVWMIENPIIILTVAFRDEGLLTAINSTEPYAQPINDLPATPVRWEVFDYLGNFVGANETYVPNNSPGGVPTRVANFILAGFNIYYGDPRFVWSGFYDTTDQVNHQAGGVLIYPWELSVPYHTFTVRVWVDGYYQLEPLQVTVPTRGNVSATVFLDRASRVRGTIAGPDFFDIARPLSWATVDLEPNNYTLSGIIDVQPGNYTTSSLDGSFQVWAPEGAYGMGVSLEGYESYAARIAIPSGSDVFVWVWLENYQLSQQPASTISSIVTNSAMVVKVHVNQLQKAWGYLS